MTRRLCVLIAVIETAAIIGAAAAPAHAESAEELLAPYRTKRALYVFLDKRAPTCAPIDTEREFCSWRLSNDRDSWEQLADTIGAGERFALACVLPRSGADRRPGSCTARVAGKGRRIGVDEAEAALANARTFLELARLVGTSPDQCQAVGDDERECIWRVSSYSPGYEQIAGLLGTRKKVRLTCTLPIETRSVPDREPESCRAAIGAR